MTKGTSQLHARPVGPARYLLSFIGGLSGKAPAIRMAAWVVFCAFSLAISQSPADSIAQSRGKPNVVSAKAPQTCKGKKKCPPITKPGKKPKDSKNGKKKKKEPAPPKTPPVNTGAAPVRPTTAGFATSKDDYHSAQCEQWLLILPQVVGRYYEPVGENDGDVVGVCLAPENGRLLPCSAGWEPVLEIKYRLQDLLVCSATGLSPGGPEALCQDTRSLTKLAGEKHSECTARSEAKEVDVARCSSQHDMVQQDLRIVELMSCDK